MATRTYVLSSTTSDLGGGAVFNGALLETTAASSPIEVSINGSGTSISRGFTESGEPGTEGATGDYTVEMNLTAANGNFQLSVQLHRVNSGGTVQQSSSVSSEQSGGSTGVKTFNFTGLDLGTWSAGDRLRVDYRFRSTASHGNNAVSIDRNTTNAEVVTPFGGPPPQNVNLGLCTETDTAQAVTARKTRKFDIGQAGARGAFLVVKGT